MTESDKAEIKKCISDTAGRTYLAIVIMVAWELIFAVVIILNFK